MKQLIGIAGRESGYWIKLMEYINSRGRIEAFVCTREDCLAKELEKRQPVVLFREVDFAQEVKFSGKEVVIYSDSASADGIYQYQPAEYIYDAMIGYLELEPVTNCGKADEKKICAVYSPLGRSGKTSFALAYARRHSFFYLGMEDYGIQGNNIHDMGEVLYHIRNRTENITDRVLNWIEEWNGVKMLGSPTLFQDIKLLSVEDYQWFFDRLRNTEFPSVIVDMGTGCLMDFDIFQLFDCIYVPVLSGKSNQNKLDLFWKLILEIYGEISDKFRVIEVPNMEWTSGEFLSLVKEKSKNGNLVLYS